ncbi:acyl-CoA dehydrogenase family protein [Plantibacter sp. Mn2098]|uniref:acyl-CoA dehydrogenase family protein n=1 Tax=Plantibacter sp. Mn2098 TaxID=3395266 RepID=UPI003BC59313
MTVNIASSSPDSANTASSGPASVGAASPRQAASYWRGNASDDELAYWGGIAEEVARALAVDVLERDRANLDPTAELDLLRDTGLVTLLDPVEFGGGGGHWESAFLAIRVLSRVDASIAQVLAYHYFNAGAIGFAVAPEEQERWYRRTIAGRWVWGDSVNPVDPSHELVPDGVGGYRLSGTKRFSTGASAGDVILVNGIVRGGDLDGKILSIVVDHDAAGVEFLGDWDALGQRLSASGAVRFTDVVVSREDVLGEIGGSSFSDLITPGIQLAFSNLYLGVAEGALAKGVELIRARRNSWFLSSAERYRDDLFVQRVVGEFVSRIAAVEALADRVGRVYASAVSRGFEVTAEDRGAVAIEVAKVKVVSTEVGVEVANRIFEVTGSSSATSAVGLDLFWRNVRTHSLHDPVDFKKLEVGAWELNGALQPVSLYT